MIEIVVHTISIWILLFASPFSDDKKRCTSVEKKIDKENLWNNVHFIYFTDNAYCSQVTSDEYQKQATECTNSALVSMMNSILDNTNFTLKEKKQRLRQFQKCHPELYAKNFHGML